MHALNAVMWARVLVVEDTRLMRKVATTALQELGIDVVVASDGQEAKEMIEAGLVDDVDLVVSDLNMPRMDGEKLCLYIRQCEALRDIPVIILTGDTKASTQARVFDSGASDFVTKPYRKDLFLTRVVMQIENWRLRRQLAERVDRATADIRRINERLIAANQSKSEFLANMSHEIRTPINGIVGFTDMLLDSELHEGQRRALNTVRTCSDALLTLVSGILDLTQIENGMLKLEVAPFNLEDLLFEAMEIVAPQASRDVQLLVDVGNVHAMVVSDSVRLRQILVNLLGNAVKFTERGHVLLRVEVVDETPERMNIALHVVDTGIGMTPEQAAIAFEPFRQVDGSRTRKYGGTGLGLTISQRLATLLDGQLTLESVQGAGSTFTLWLGIDKQAWTAPADDDEGAPDLSGQRCLIVEDSPIAAAIVAETVRRLGMVPAIAESAEMALKMIRPDDPLVLVDIMMPTMDGHDFMAAVRRLRGQAVPHSIAITADVRPSTAVRIRESGFDGYLYKPIRRSALIKSIRRLMAQDVEEPPPTQTDSIANREQSVSYRVLVAEDNMVNQLLIMELLKRMGHVPTLAKDGVEAVARIREDRFDLVLMDMQMPNMDGLDATRTIRALGCATPICALTANAFESDRVACFDAGMDDFLTKPLKRDTIRQTILRLCAHSPSTAGAESFRVLIVEDEPASTVMLRGAIEARYPSWTVRTASDGMDAMVLLGSLLPHLIISDMGMPRMDGCSLVEFVRSNDRYSATKIVILTALPPDDPEVRRVRRLGVSAVEHKPCDIQSLYKQIQKATHESRRVQAVEETAQLDLEPTS